VEGSTGPSDLATIGSLLARTGGGRRGGAKVWRSKTTADAPAVGREVPTPPSSSLSWLVAVVEAGARVFFSGPQPLPSSLPRLVLGRGRRARPPPLPHHSPGPLLPHPPPARDRYSPSLRRMPSRREGMQIPSLLHRNFAARSACSVGALPRVCWGIHENPSPSKRRG
jgi:hypothetical protein